MDDLRRLTTISWSAIAGLAVVLVVAAWLAWPGPSSAGAPRARQYRDYDLCLLTDERGIQGDPASKVWQGLQTVSLESRSRVSYLPVAGEQTEAAAAQMVATQVQQSCDIIVAVGGPQVAAAAAAAGSHPAVDFVTVGGGATGPNLSTVDAGSVAGRVRAMMR